jgi:hypothetical protein
MMPIPAAYSWETLTKKSGDELEVHYNNLLPDSANCTVDIFIQQYLQFYQSWQAMVLELLNEAASFRPLRDNGL